MSPPAGAGPRITAQHDSKNGQTRSKPGMSVAAMTVAGSTRQEGTAVDISPAGLVVPSGQEVVWVSNVC